MTHIPKHWYILALMVLSALLAHVIKPHDILALKRGNINLDLSIPQQFGEWRSLEKGASQIVNPQQRDLISKLYSQALTRSYINDDGIVMMLSIAYGANQSGSLALHYPEVCYPAQGFEVKTTQKSQLDTVYGPIRVRRLNTQLGNRTEPLTYWSTIGNYVVRDSTEAKLTQLQYGLNGQIPDGLIFRISNLAADPVAAYRLQGKFVDQLLEAISPNTREFLIGSSAVFNSSTLK